MSKYIIELGEDANMVQVISVTQSGNAYIESTVYVEYLEELNSDYINEHFGDLQDTAYQRGLDDAWEAARKILQMYDFTVFGLEHDGVFESPLNEGQQMTPQEAIEKLKAYEDDKIKRGDIVNVKGSCNDDLLGVVTKVREDNCYIMWGDGSGGAWSKDSVVKTGKHIDVDKFFDEIAT